MLQRVLAISLLFYAVTEAFIEFENSRIYDEDDFEGQGTVYVPNYCSPGCNIFVSVPETSRTIAQNIKIEAFQGAQISLVTADVTQADGRKTPYRVQEGNAQVNFINSNVGLKSAPILVWIVRGDASYQDTEVYDGKGASRAAANAGVITVMSTEPFIVDVVTAGPPFPFEVITAGFDALGDKDNCRRVIQEDAATYQDLRADVRSPLITLKFDSGPTQVALNTFKNNFETLDLSRTQFVTSPGYIGCDVKTNQLGMGVKGTRTFRSSLYDPVSNYAFHNDDLVSFAVSGDLNLDGDHPVSIVADTQKPLNWAGLNADAPSVVLTAQDLAVTWTRSDADLNQYFMLRVQPSGVEKRTTTAEPEPDDRTTTLEPEPAVRTTTTEDGDSRTTTESEPAARTTTGEPGAVKTTTVDDEPVRTTSESERTTTLEPEEPIRTTTEPEKTTSLEPVITTEQPIKTVKTVPPKTTTAYQKRTKTPYRTTSLPIVHPKSTTIMTKPTVTASTTATTERTTSAAGTDSLILPGIVALLTILP